MLNHITAMAYNGFDYGTPAHSVGYADESGYVLYSENLFDVVLHKDSAMEERSVEIPFRLVFYTNERERKSFFMESYWSFSIFDSYVSDADSSRIIWQMPDLNVVYLKKCSENQWMSNDSSFRLTKEKNGDVHIKSSDGFLSSLFVYRQGLLWRMHLNAGESRYSFTVSRGKDVMALLSGSSRDVLSIKREKTGPGLPETHTLKYGGREIKFLSGETDIYFNNVKSKIRLLCGISREGANEELVYESGKDKSSVAWKGGAVERRFLWSSKDGRITGDSVSSYETEVLGADTVRVVRNTPWGRFCYKNEMENGIVDVESDCHFLKFHRIKSTPALSGRNRTIDYRHKLVPGKTLFVRNLYDNNGKLLRTICKE